MPGTLGSRLATIEASLFAGRAHELALLEALLEPDREERVMLVRGPGGIGKSALLRELARRAEARGFTPHWVEGREILPVPDALEDAVAGLTDVQRPLLIIDSYERIASVDGHLRRTILPALPDSTLVVIAGREVPYGEWTTGAWRPLIARLEVGPLDERDAMWLLRSQGIEAQEIAGEIVAWAGGSPLALTLAAQAAAADAAWDPRHGLERPEVIKRLVRGLVDEDVGPNHLPTLGAAAIARVTTGGLLADVLTDATPDTEYEWLASRTFTEPLGDGIAPHDLVRKAVGSDLRRRHAEVERDLRRRIADHLYARARAEGSLLMSIDLGHLAENPAIRWGYSWSASARFRVDDVREGDLETLEERLRAAGDLGRWEGARRFLVEAPEHVGVVRDAQDRIAGYMVATTPATAPRFCDTDPILGPRLADAERRGGGTRAVVCRDAVDLTHDSASGVVAMLGMAAMLRSARANPRYAYLPINPAFPRALEFSAALGAEHLPALDAKLAGERIECHVVDYGPGGLLAAQRDLVYTELGLAPPEITSADEQAFDRREAVRDALRHYHLPHRLARSGLATGEGTRQRAAAVRSMIEAAVEGAFGDSAGDQLLRSVLVRGYLDPTPGHEAAAHELAVSRSTYFRRLRAAVERVADYIAEH